MEHVGPGVRFRKPFIIPDSLEELRGPISGRFTIPKRLYWPLVEPVTIDLDNDGQKTILYAAVMTEGTIEDFRTMVNGDELIRLWGQIGLSPMILQLWEDRFSHLCGGIAHVR